VGAQRLAAQRIARREHADPAALVGWMGAMQAQDPAGARWAVGMRLAGRRTTESAILRALDAGSVIRTHLMRGTWQLVAAADLHWMLPLVAPVVMRRAAHRMHQLDLDDRTFSRARRALEHALRDGGHLTRLELRAVVEKAGISTANDGRLSHLLAKAELEGVICSGSARGKSATYALVDLRVPRPPRAWPRERARAELGRRYFRSRGPATVEDFIWWSGLPPGDARAALESIEPELARECICGRDTWRDRDATPATRAALAEAYLAPPFDELLIAYKDRTALLDPAHARRMNAGGGMLAPAVVLGGRVVGTWRRTLGRKEVAIAINFFDRLTKDDAAVIAAAAERYAHFLERKPSIVPTTGMAS
jgi:hypothetical protein